MKITCGLEHVKRSISWFYLILIAAHLIIISFEITQLNVILGGFVFLPSFCLCAYKCDCCNQKNSCLYSWVLILCGCLSSRFYGIWNT